MIVNKFCPSLGYTMGYGVALPPVWKKGAARQAPSQTSFFFSPWVSTEEKRQKGEGAFTFFVPPLSPTLDWPKKKKLKEF